MARLMINKLQSHTKTALFIALLWTLIVAFLTVNLIVSSKNDAYDNAVFEAKLSADNMSTIIQWLTSFEDGYDALKVLVKPEQSMHSQAEKSLSASRPKANMNILAQALVFTPIKFKDKKIKVIFGNEKLIAAQDYFNSNQQLDDWEQQAFIKLQYSQQQILSTELISNEVYIRLMVPILLGKNCLLCQKLKVNDATNLLGGISVSIAIQPYYNKANHHIWKMGAYFAVIWGLGMLAIIFGYIKTNRDISKKIKNFEENIYSLVDIIEKRDTYTAGHTRRVAKYALLIAKKLTLAKKERNILYRASMLHDIGKISTPDSVLLKPGKLSTVEYEIIKNHVVSSFEILSNVTMYKDIAEIVRFHHEYYDGSGYPQGLKGNKIPYLSQILTVADGFDAMTTDRIYKGRKTITEALHEIEQLSGKQFNPTIVPFALKALANVKISANISQLPASILEHERFSSFYKDSITQVYNKHYFELIISKRPAELNLFRYALLLRLHNFTQFNEENSWSKGDEKLVEVANSLQNIDENSLVFRLFGDDFIILLKGKLSSFEEYQPLTTIVRSSPNVFMPKTYRCGCSSGGGP